MKLPIRKSLIDRDFTWKSLNGSVWKPKDMTTSHLFNCLRMSWDAIVNVSGIGTPLKFKEKRNINYEDYLNSVCAFVLELNERKDLDIVLNFEYNKILDQLKDPKIIKALRNYKQPRSLLNRSALERYIDNTIGDKHGLFEDEFEDYIQDLINDESHWFESPF